MVWVRRVEAALDRRPGGCSTVASDGAPLRKFLGTAPWELSWGLEDKLGSCRAGVKAAWDRLGNTLYPLGYT